MNDKETEIIIGKNIGTLWGGLIETMFSQYNEKEIEALEEGKKFLEWKERLDSIEKTQEIKEIIRLVFSFSENERNYINSPLLDQLFSTIKCKYPLRKAILKGYKNATKFYMRRNMYSLLLVEWEISGHDHTGYCSGASENTIEPYIRKLKFNVKIEDNNVKIMNLEKLKPKSPNMCGDFYDVTLPEINVISLACFKNRKLMNLGLLNIEESGCTAGGSGYCNGEFIRYGKTISAKLT